MKTYWHLMQYNATLHTTNDSIHVRADAFVEWLSQGLWPTTHSIQTLMTYIHSAHQNSVQETTFTVRIETNNST